MSEILESDGVKLDIIVCDCVNTRKMFARDGYGGAVLVMTYYPACDKCETQEGIVLTEEIEEREHMTMPDLPLNTFIPTVDFNKIRILRII